MNKNVYIKSMLRQPIRTLTLILLISLSFFAFISRWAEYIIVTEEVARLEYFYRSVGYLQNIDAPEAGVREGADIIAQSPYLRFEDRRRFAQGITIGKTAPNFVRDNDWFFSASYFMTMDIFHTDAFFYGIVESISHESIRLGLGWMQTPPIDFLVLYVSPDDIAVGYPRIAPIGRMIRLMLPVDEAFFERFAPERAAMIRELLLYDVNEGMPSLNLKIGERYLFRGSHFLELRETMISSFLMVPLYINSNIWYLHKPDGSRFDEAKFPKIAEEIELIKLNQLSLQIITTKDMELMPLTQRVGYDVFLRGGRWLDYDDYVNARPVAVMHHEMARAHGLRLGDTITLEIRDMQYHWSAMIPSYYEGWRDYPAVTVDVEIVGLYGYGIPIRGDPIFAMRNIYIPDSMMPPEFGASQPGMPEGFISDGSYSFAVRPRDQNAFIALHRDQLNDIGFRIVFRDGSPQEFVDAADALAMFLTVNLWIFSVASIVILALAIFIYLRIGMRNFAILRAMGVSAKKASLYFSSCALFWLPFCVVSSAAAWHFALSRAGSALHTLTADAPDLQTQAGLSTRWLTVLCVVGFVIMLAVLSTGISIISRRPVLELLQGQQSGKKHVHAVNINSPEHTKITENPVTSIKLGILPVPVFEEEHNPIHAYEAELRRILRQVVRSPVKTLFIVGTALAFVFAIGWMQHTMTVIEAEIDYLYNTADIQVHLRRMSEHDLFEIPLSRSVPMGDLIWAHTVHSLMSSDFVRDAYLTSASNIMHLLPTLDDGSFPYALRELAREDMDFRDATELLFAFNHMDLFLNANKEIDIIYTKGFDESYFVYDDRHFITPIPIIIHENRLEYLGLNLGDLAYIANLAPGIGRMEWKAVIIGIYTGVISQEVPGGMLYEAMLLPLAALEYIRGSALRYNDAELFIDARMVRELSEFRAFTDNMLRWPRAGLTSFRAVYFEGDLLFALEPLEQNLRFLKILYPITLVLAFIIGTGFAMLIMAQNTKTAAIMRVLGATKRRIRVILCAELILVTLIGIILGLIVMIITTTGLNAQLLLAPSLYLGGSLIGTFLGSVFISRRTPIELLQVKE